MQHVEVLLLGGAVGAGDTRFYGSIIIIIYFSVQVRTRLAEMAPEYIRLPSVPEMEATARRMEDKYKLPGFAYAVDGMHVRFDGSVRDVQCAFQIKKKTVPFKVCILFNIMGLKKFNTKFLLIKKQTSFYEKNSIFKLCSSKIQASNP